MLLLILNAQNNSLDRTFSANYTVKKVSIYLECCEVIK